MIQLIVVKNLDNSSNAALIEEGFTDITTSKVCFEKKKNQMRIQQFSHTTKSMYPIAHANTRRENMLLYESHRVMLRG